MKSLDFKSMCCAVNSYDILTSFNEQQARYMRQKGFKVCPVNSKAMTGYVRECSASFTRQLSKCKTGNDYRELHLAYAERVALSNNEFLNALGV